MQVPAYLQQRRQSQAPALFSASDSFLGGITAALPPHLSIADNRFTLIDASGNEKLIPTHHFDIVMLGANSNTSRVFYDPSKPFDPRGTDNGPPLCFSDNGVGPSVNAQEPQSHLCQLCPNAAWNSAVSRVTGKGVPACSTGKKIAFIVPGDPDDIVYFMRVPPASLKNLASYINALKPHSTEAYEIVTRLHFESQGILKFTPVDFIDEDSFNRQQRAFGEGSTGIIATITGMLDTAIPADRQLATPRQAAPAQTGPAPQRMAPPPQQQTAPAPQQQTGGFLGAPAGTAPAPQAQQAPAPKQTRAPRQPKADPPAQVPQDDLAIPSFLRRTQQAPVQQETAAPQSQSTAPQQTQQFGMVDNPAAPPSDINSALASAFNLPME